MSFSEQADFSAEHTKEPGLRERLSHERDTVGSTTAYLNALGVYYQSVPEHAANMLQLQRMAGMVTNPNNEPSYPHNLTNAFYWGEILAYTSQERLIGEEWATTSYKLFNRNIVMLLEDVGDDAMSHYGDMQEVADMMTGALETADAEVMPSALDQFIIEWSEQLTRNQEERWQIILGFRHIIMQVANVAQEYKDDDYDEDPAAVAAANEFFDMMGAAEIDDVQAIIEPIDDVRDHLMEKYADYRQQYGAINEDDADELDDAAFYLMQALNRDFVKSERVSEGDFLQIGGNAVFVICDENLRSNNTYVLGENEFIKGTAEAIAVTEVPSFDAITHIRGSRADINSDEAIAQDEVNPLGVLLILKDPVLVGPDGTYLQVAAGVLAGVMMNNPDMHMTKFLL